MADTKSKSQPPEGADGYRDASTTQGGPSVLPASLSMTDGCVGLVPSIACGGGGIPVGFALRLVPSLRDSVPFYWRLPRPYVRGYCMSSLSGLVHLRFQE